jgi:hypothetical protein
MNHRVGLIERTTVTVKPLAAISVAAIGAIGAAGVISLAFSTPVTPQVTPVVFGVPIPLDPGAPVPSSGELIGVLNGLQNPGVPFASKGNLVEGGVSDAEGRIADRQLRKASEKGQLPLSFRVTNIAPAGPGAATADVTASGPSLAPTTQNMTFVDEDGWKLSRGSALALVAQFRGAS